jgi:hypothetical protein
MERDFEIVIFNVTHEDGVYTATSPQLTGVCVVHRDKNRIIEDMPNIVRLWYKRNRRMDVEAFLGPSREFDESSAFPMLTLPAELAARELARVAGW